MIRQRVSLRSAPWSALTRTLTIIAAIVLGYGGAMVALAALKVDPATIEKLSRYRAIDDYAAGVTHADFTTELSLIAGFAGLLVFLFFAFLTLQALPRPHLTRAEVDLPDQGRGETIVRPRAVERVAEHAAMANRTVVDARGRLGDDELHIDVALDRAAGIPDSLADVRRRVRAQLQQHDLPLVPVNVTLTGFDRPTRRDDS